MKKYVIMRSVGSKNTYLLQKTRYRGLKTIYRVVQYLEIKTWYKFSIGMSIHFPNTEFEIIKQSDTLQDIIVDIL